MNATKETQQIWTLLKEVKDPEIPVLTVVDMGVIRDVKLNGDEVEVVITPTYTGCPAMDMIAVNIKAALQDKGYNQTKITTVLSPAWTTEWLTEDARRRLKEYGIAPPVGQPEDKSALFPKQKIVPCPRCDSENTKVVSSFGSTACKALYKCEDCLEPFDYFKCH